MAASSCFPPVFPRMYLTNEELGLTYSEFKETFSLNDGGVAGNRGIKVLFSRPIINVFATGQTYVCDAECGQRRRPAGGEHH